MRTKQMQILDKKLQDLEDFICYELFGINITEEKIIYNKIEEIKLLIDYFTKGEDKNEN